MFRSILRRTCTCTSPRIIPSLRRSFITYHPLHQQTSTSQPPPSQKHKIVCALYEGGDVGRNNPAILGCVENALGLREWLTSLGHELIVTTDKDGPNSVVERNLHDATIVISQPFWPIYLDEARLEKAKKLQHAITAGVGSDHVNLDAAVRHGITVTEVTGSNVVSVAEHVIMMILSLVRNYLPAHEIAKNGGWDIAKIVDEAYDLEEMHVGTVAAGRIGLRVLQRLKPFGVHLHYTDKVRLKPAIEKELGVTYHPTVRSLVRSCDVVTINAPLHPETENLFNADMIASMKRGSYLINTARARIVDRDAIVQAVTTGHLKGYAGDVWYPQPAPPDHPWRRMPHNGMTPHYSGSTLSAQARYAAGTREILSCIFDNKPIRPEYLIVHRGALVSPAYSIGVDLVKQQDARTLKQQKDPYKDTPPQDARTIKPPKTEPES